MKCYDCGGLQELLGIGRDAAYKILREYGFRIGKRQMRISEKQIERYANHGSKVFEVVERTR